MKRIPLILVAFALLASRVDCEAQTPQSATAPKLTWRTGEPAPAALPPPTKAMTLVIGFSNLMAKGDLVAWNAADGRSALRFLIGEVQAKPSLIAEVATDARPTPLQLSVPLAVIGPAVPHEIVLRYFGHRLELFADGVLVDEDWPLGSLLSVLTPASVARSVTHLSLWERILTDDEVRGRAGVHAGLAERENRYLGPELPVGQFWRPRGLNTFAGDCMPFFHDGRFHLYYLFDRHQHASKWKLGAHQWAHASTTDLVNWEHHPMAVPISEEEEGSICTGSVFFHGGTHHAFYALRMPDRSAAPLHAATSSDGIHFTKQPALARLTSPYFGGSARDPVVFREASTGLFHMLLTTRLLEPEIANRGGCLAHLVSRDLKQWEQREPFLVPGYPGEPECPDFFEWHGWYYLIFSNQGIARYRMSRHPLGPWTQPKVDVFDGPQSTVMKTAAFTRDRRIGVAFVRAGGYGGHLVFREIIQHPDGTLGTKWPAEMIPPTGTVREVTGIKLSASQELKALPLGKAPKDFLLRARVKPAPAASYFGIRFGAGEKMEGGIELRFEPRREKVGLRPADVRFAEECEASSIYDVSGLDQPFDFALLVKGDLVDVSINDQRTLVARMNTSDAPGLFAFAQNADVEFEQIELRALVSPPMK